MKITTSTGIELDSEGHPNMKENIFKINKIYLGDCVDIMKQFPDSCIDLTVTSPPYDNLRTYNGYSFNFEETAKNIFRITKQGGIIVWVVGDETKNFCESLTSFRQALYFHEIGFNLLDTMIYYKNNVAPSYPSIRRYTNQFEYMFVFSKGRPKTFNPIQEEKDILRKNTVSFRQKDGSLTKKVILNDYNLKDRTNIWKYTVGNNKVAHPAVFPEQLAKDHILSWSNEGDLIFDPFVGSGTTCKMARLNKRNYIGIEISKEYYQIAINRVKEESEGYTKPLEDNKNLKASEGSFF